MAIKHDKVGTQKLSDELIFNLWHDNGLESEKQKYKKQFVLLLIFQIKYKNLLKNKIRYSVFKLIFANIILYLMKIMIRIG